MFKYVRKNENFVVQLHILWTSSLRAVTLEARDMSINSLSVYI